MAKKEVLSEQEQKVFLLEATRRVFDQYGFATRSMLEAETKKYGIDKFVGQLVYGNLHPILNERQSKNPRVISTFPEISRLPVEKTTLLRDNGQEVVLFYLPEREVVEENGTKVIHQTAGQAKDAYKEYERKREKAREQKAAEEMLAKATRQAEDRRRREEALSPSKATLTLLAYRKGTPVEDFQRMLAEQKATQAKKTFVEIKDYSQSYDSLTNVLELSLAAQILQKGLVADDMPTVLGDMRKGIIATAKELKREAEEMTPRIIEDLTKKLSEKKGQNYNAVMSMQRQYIPLVTAIVSKELETSDDSIDPNIFSWNDYDFRSYPTEAAYRYLHASENATTSEFHISQEALDDDFLYHVLFFDLLCQMYFPNTPLLGEQGELMATGLHLIVDQFVAEEIVALLHVPLFDREKAQADFDAAEKKVLALTGSQGKGRRVSRDVIRHAEEERKRARQILQQSSSVKPDDIQKRIKEAIQSKIPSQRPNPQDYQERNGEEPRAYTKAKAVYDRQIKEGKHPVAPIREDYLHKEASRGFKRDDGLYETMEWIKDYQRESLKKLQAGNISPYMRRPFISGGKRR